MNDLISRRAAIDALDKQIKQCCKALGSLSLSDIDKHAVEVEMASLSAYSEMLENLPTVQPEPSIPLSWIEKPVIYAHWIPCENETGEGSNTYKCSACGEIQMLIDGTPKENGWKYCPHCGARMNEKVDD